MLDNQSGDLFGPTPWQTTGPFFHYALPWKGCGDLITGTALGARLDLLVPAHDLLHQAALRGAPSGDAIDIGGRVLDARGCGVCDALVEIWQADAAGRYAPNPFGNDSFTGFGRCATAEDGSYRFRTIRPGAVPAPQGCTSAPHIAIGVLGRGILKRLITRLYFADEPDNLHDQVLASVPAARRSTLVARRNTDCYEFNIVLQGDAETVFFQC